MLSFLQHLKSEGPLSTPKADKADIDGKSAYIYTGGSKTQIPKHTTRIRVDKSVKHLDGRVNYGHIFSMELPESIISMDANIIQGTSCLAPSKIVQAMQTKLASYKTTDVFKSVDMTNLRNVAFPPELCDADLPTFDTASSDLGKVLPSKRNHEYLYRMYCNGYSLRNRFNGLPLHRVCYYHSHYSSEVAIRNLSGEMGAQSNSMSRASRGDTDCIGMTPLHILTCSTKHHIDMYELLVRRYPDHLIIEDVWGDIPLLYAIWGQAPREIVEFLAASINEYHPTYNINWQKMLQTLCVCLAPLSSLEYLIETIRSSFPTNHQLQDMDWNHMVHVMCIEAKAPEEHVTSFVTQYRDYFVGLEQVSLELAKEVKYGFKRWWLKIGISKRLVLIGKEKATWQKNIESLIMKCPTGISANRDMKRRHELMETILRKLVMYETVAQLWVIELALWKAKIKELQNPEDRRCKSYRSRCKYTSGADVIIPNVMEYLLPGSASSRRTS